MNKKSGKNDSDLATLLGAFLYIILHEIQTD